MSNGVMFARAATWYQLSLAYQIGDATPTLHLFRDDQPIDTLSDPQAFIDYAGNDFDPLPVPNGYWEPFGLPPDNYYAILNATWDLDYPSDPAARTLYGWFLTAPSARLGFAVNLFGGRFTTPIPIPPAGLTLTLAEVQLPLHDCVTSPPPPIPTGIWIDPFVDTDGTTLAAHAPIVGGNYTAVVGTFQTEGGRVIPTSDVAGDNVSFDVGTGDYTVSFTAGMDWVSGSNYERPRLQFRVSSPGNSWTLFAGLEFGIVGLLKTVGGADTLVLSASKTFVSPSTCNLTCVAVGNSLTLYFNDTLVGSVTDSFNASATGAVIVLEKVGSGGKCSWRNLQFRR